MTNYSERIDNIFQKLVSDITIAGYGKEDEPNDLIDKDDIQPFAGYLFHENKAKQAITSLIKELVVEAKLDENNMYIRELTRHYFPSGPDEPHIPLVQFHERISEIKAQQEEV